MNLLFQRLKRGEISGQIVILVILMLAVTVVFVAIILNLGAIAQIKTMVSIAADSAAINMASAAGSFSNSLIEKALEGNTEVCATTQGFWDFIWNICAIILGLVLAAPTGGWSLVLTVIGIIALLYSAIQQQANFNKALTGAREQFNKMAADLTDQQRFPEIAVQTGIPLIVSDPVMVPDEHDVDMDFLTAVDEDEIPRFAGLYSQRLIYLLDSNTRPDLKTAIQNFLLPLESFGCYLSPIPRTCGKFGVSLCDPSKPDFQDFDTRLGVDVGYVTASEDTLTIHFLQGWNGFALPFNVSDNHISTLFPAGTTVFKYDSSYVQVDDTLEPGVGYWVNIGSEAKDVVFTKVSDITSLNLRLNQSWNVIGTVSVPVDASSLQFTPDVEGGAITGSISFYNAETGTYEEATVLQPGVAYWIKVSSPGTLHIQVPGPLPTTPPPTTIPPGCANEWGDCSARPCCDTVNNFCTGSQCVPCGHAGAVCDDPQNPLACCSGFICDSPGTGTCQPLAAAATAVTTSAAAAVLGGDLSTEFYKLLYDIEDLGFDVPSWAPVFQSCKTAAICTATQTLCQTRAFGICVDSSSPPPGCRLAWLECPTCPSGLTFCQFDRLSACFENTSLPFGADNVDALVPDTAAFASWASNIAFGDINWLVTNFESWYPELYRKDASGNLVGGWYVTIRDSWEPIAQALYQDLENAHIWIVNNRCGGIIYNCDAATRDILNRMQPAASALVSRFRNKAINFRNAVDQLELTARLNRQAQDSGKMTYSWFDSAGWHHVFVGSEAACCFPGIRNFHPDSDTTCNRLWPTYNGQRGAGLGRITVVRYDEDRDWVNFFSGKKLWKFIFHNVNMPPFGGSADLTGRSCDFQTADGQAGINCFGVDPLSEANSPFNHGVKSTTCVEWGPYAGQVTFIPCGTYNAKKAGCDLQGCSQCNQKDCS